MVHGNPIDGAELAAHIPAPWREPTLDIARALGDAGHRAWVVGGTVRDLILNRKVKDVDIVTAALPDVVEGLFPKTVPVGKAFGIIVVVLDGLEFEVATFREESGYSDKRRPDTIQYAADPESDARRRDFTCNALFLDPLDGTIVDPTSGLEDLQRRELRAVGDPVHRFREDGLRLLRMARFSAALGLTPVPGLVEAARAERASLGGVSPERVLGELEKIFACDQPAIAIEMLETAELSGLCLPGWNSAVFDAAERARRIQVLAAMGGALPVASGLAILFGTGELRETLARVTALRESQDLRESAARLWSHSLLLEDWAIAPKMGTAFVQAPQEEAPEDLGRRVLTARMDHTGAALDIADARAAADGRSPELLAQLRKELERQDAEAPTDPFVLPSRRLLELGVPKGPPLGLAIARMRAASLGGAFEDAEGAERWLAETGLIK